MRYTTIIDITEMPRLYDNINVRLVYLHLTLRSGYHDNDRDLIARSIRRLAYEVGISVAAVRHSLQVLRSAGMIVVNPDRSISVKKWVVTEAITARAKTRKQQKQQETAAVEAEIKRRRDEQRRIEEQRIEELHAQGKHPFAVYYEEMQQKAAAGDASAQEYVAKKDNQAFYNQVKDMFKITK